MNIVPRPRLFRESLRRSIIPTTRTTVWLVWNVVKFQPANISSGSQKALLFHRAPHLYRADRERIRIPLSRIAGNEINPPSPSSSLAGGEEGGEVHGGGALSLLFAKLQGARAKTRAQDNSAKRALRIDARR